jgi:ABC-type transport system substrate-binding protein
VLFTDIVGSTERAAQLGDRAWRELLERHHAVVRRELKAFRGREMDTAGDGFFAVFEAPERAVRCAESITSAVASLGIQVRAGVHTGECEIIGGKVGGMAVNIGARVAALAAPGQVLVSGSVRDLMTGSDRHFEGGERHALKGVAGEWWVYRLVFEEISGDASTSGRPSMLPLYTRRQRRGVFVVLAAVLVVALAVSTGYLLVRSDADVVLGENAVGVIGPGEDPRVSAAVGVGQRPTALAADRDSVWVTNSATNSVSRIDRRTRVSFPISVGSSPSGVAVGGGAVWVANSGDATVSKIDPGTSRVTPIPVRPGPTGIVVAFGSVWVTNALDASVTEIDPNTNEILEIVAVGAGPTGIASGAGYLWVTNQSDGTVTRFHPETLVADPSVKVGNGPVGVVVADGAAWVANKLDGSLSRIDVEDLSVTSRTLNKSGGAYGVAAAGHSVWVSNEHAGTLMRVTTRTFQVAATVRLRSAPLGLALVAGDLWFTSARGLLHRGGVLTIVGNAFDGWDPPVIDPTIGNTQSTARLGAMTNDGLVGFLRASGVQGAAIVPDLATSLPAPTGGGLTYTFHLRTGVRYSTGAPVLAGDIRRGIERSVVHPEAPGYLASAIVGGKACRSVATKAVAANKPRPDCDLSEGIAADDRNGTVTFHLTKPTPEFLYQLSLPSASAVPQGTPVDLPRGTFMPSTGPYMIRSYTPQQDAAGYHGRLELVRNPHFHEWSSAAQPDGYPDRIVLETGFSDEAAVSRVTGGTADALWLGAPKAAVNRLRTRYGLQVHTTAGSFTNYLFLNATKPPFDNRDARRAVAFGLDRGALTSGGDSLSGPVTCQLIPPDFAAYKPYCPFTLGGAAGGHWTGPDLAAAQELVRKSGTRGAKVVLVIPFAYDPTWRNAAQRVVTLLDGLGYRASLHARPTDGYAQFSDVVADPSNDFTAGLFSWGADYPAPSTYLTTLASCDPDLGFYNFSGYCDAELDKQIAAAIAQQVTEPGRASDAWTAIDRAVVDAAAVIPFGTDLHQDFVSRRVGNILVNPIAGPLFSQMWVR